MNAFERLKSLAGRLKNECHALYLAYRDPRVPWWTKLAIAVIIGYWLSPIDLIPDFVPVLGYLDDLVLIPLGVALVIRMMPADVLEECRRKARAEAGREKPKNWAAAAVIMIIWTMLGWAVFLLASRYLWKNY
ncbi:MAG: YkvA family protein [Thermodesulfobacteriota bacterium]